MDSKNPLVSVILPTYNRSNILSRAIESVLIQTYENLELIIVDDASTDDTEEVVSSYEDDRINYIQKTDNQGGAAARNTGILKSDGEIVAFIDSDDEWAPSKLQKQVDVFIKDAKVGVVYTGTTLVNNSKKTKGKVPTEKGYIYNKQLYMDNISPTSAVAVRRECFTLVGLFDPSLEARQDYDLWLRLSRNYKFDYVSESLVTIYREHEDRISSNISNRIQGQLRILKKIQPELETFGFIEERKIRSNHYLSIGRHAWIHEDYETSTKFTIDSLQIYPLNPFAFILLLLSMCGISPETQALQCINRIKKAVSEYSN